MKTTPQKPVIGLVGLSYSGKSTAAESVSGRLNTLGFNATVIKKDEAIRERGYALRPADTPRKKYGAGSRDETGIRQLMNQWLQEQLPQNDLVLLEGGVRTLSSTTAIMRGLEDKTKMSIVSFDITAIDVLKRFRQRRRETDRPDDSLLIAAAKISGQLLKNITTGGQQIADISYYHIDASQPAVHVSDELLRICLDGLDQQQIVQG